MRKTPLAAAAALLLGAGPAWTQGAAAVMPAPAAIPAPADAAASPARRPAIVLKARSLNGRPELDAAAEGEVELEREGLVLQADRLTYDQVEDRARASGNVRVRRPGQSFWGPALELQVQRFQGFFEQPRFELERQGAGGSAARVDFIDSARSVAIDARYTSCPRDGSGDPDWVLQADRVSLDVERNEGVAEGAVLRFLGTPILALPKLSFPLSDARKSGWLPPNINLDSRSGLVVAVPWYWNLAPHRDMTIVPRVVTRRGVGAEAEFRYLEPRFDGVLTGDVLPADRLADRTRSALQWRHDGLAGARWRYGVDALGVSDDAWWKDFPDASRSLTPRLLAQRAFLERAFELGAAEGLAYARLQRWQVLQDADSPLLAPYQRSPQLGVRLGGAAAGFEATIQGEFNRFTLPPGEFDVARPTGDRVHLLGSLARPWRVPGGFVVPRLALNAADYRLDRPLPDGRTSASRVIPTFSLDAGLEFERETSGFGRRLRQTLEPRLLYVNTPYRAQAGLPNFDSAGKDFNDISIFTDNAFSGVDRVSDAHPLTAGVATRVVDAASGVEVLRLAAVQRFLFDDQRVTPRADGGVDGPPIDQRLSDLLLRGATNLVPGWTLEGALQFGASESRLVRSIASARYSPGPYRTIGTTYRLARGLSEQVELGWQWPIAGTAADAPAAGPGTGSCQRRWYSVGHVNYSLRDSRLTDSLVGFEVDSGCWIGRIVAERQSTGRSEATTRLLLQLELVGLSRLGSNPLRVLRENIPGYRLLRDDPRDAPSASSP